MYKEIVRKAGCSLRSFFTSLPGWARQNFIWGLLVVPILFVVLMYTVIGADMFGWQKSGQCKADLEIAHPALLGCAVVLAVGAWARTKDFSLACLCFLCGGAFAREILGQGYSFVFVSVMIGVIICAERNKDRMTTLLTSKWSTSLLAMTFICYIFSQLLDRGVIKRIGRLVTMDGSWKPLYSSQIEESLETLGGLFLLITVISLTVSAKKKLTS